MAKRIAIFGAGRIGATHAANVANSKAAVLHAVVDLRWQAAEELAKKHGAVASTDIEAVMADPDVDGVIIASSTDTHVDLVLLAALRGKPILCEKPIDLGLARVDRCLVEVERAGVPLQLGFNRRFDPIFGALAERLRAGAIGKLELLRITSRDPAPPPIEYVQVSGGLFRDMMIHDFDTARWLLGAEPVRVHAAGSCMVDPEIADCGDVDTAVVTLQTAAGVLCTIDNSRRATYGYDQRIEAHGALGMLQADNPRPTTVLYASEQAVSSDRLMTFFLDRYAAAYQRELDHFLAVIDGAPPKVTGVDGRAALVLAEAAVASLASGKSVEV